MITKPGSDVVVVNSNWVNSAKEYGDVTEGTTIEHPLANEKKLNLLLKKIDFSLNPSLQKKLNILVSAWTDLSTDITDVRVYARYQIGTTAVTGNIPGQKTGITLLPGNITYPQQNFLTALKDEPMGVGSTYLEVNISP